MLGQTASVRTEECQGLRTSRGKWNLKLGNLEHHLYLQMSQRGELTGLRSHSESEN